MYLLRAVKKEDLNDLVELSRFLDTVNFPNDQNKLAEAITFSSKSFSGDLEDPKGGVYQFVLSDTTKNKVIGVSKILAHHGTPQKPHYYWQVSEDERHSETTGIRKTHQVLTLGKDTSGHTEIAGIIVHPDYQGKRLGKQLFYVRLLYMAIHRNRFLDRVISELLPPLDQDGRSALWEAYGQKFTGLTYQEADHLSQYNKEFIETLFPLHKIYTCLLPPEARKVIGQVGQSSLPAKYLAEKNGLKYLKQIDPFDGGPHFGCHLDDVVGIKNVKLGFFQAKLDKEPSAKSPLGLLCSLTGKTFQTVETSVHLLETGGKLSFEVPKITTDVLGLEKNDEVAFLPYP